MTSPEYILEFMRDQDLRYFIVCNGWDREVVKIFTPGDLEDHINKLKSFLNNKLTDRLADQNFFYSIF